MPYRVMLVGTHKHQGCFRNYWPTFSDVSQSIYSALDDAASDPDFHNGRPADVIPTSDDVPETFAPTDRENLYVTPSYFTFPISDTNQIVFPLGIVPCDIDGQDSDDIRVSSVFQQEAGYALTEAVIDGRLLRKLLNSSVDWLGSVDALEVRLMSHWEQSSTTEVWLLNDPSTPLAFAYDHHADIIDNGFIELAFYSRASDTVIRLSEHKTLRCTSGRSTRPKEYQDFLTQFELNPTSEFATLEMAHHHYHYHDPDARDRNLLRQLLVTKGFTNVDNIDDSVLPI